MLTPMAGRWPTGTVVVVAAGGFEVVVVGAARAFGAFPLGDPAVAPGFTPAPTAAAAAFCFAAFSTAWPAASTDAMADGPLVAATCGLAGWEGCALAG